MKLCPILSLCVVAICPVDTVLVDCREWLMSLQLLAITDADIWYLEVFDT